MSCFYRLYYLRCFFLRFFLVHIHQATTDNRNRQRKGIMHIQPKSPRIKRIIPRPTEKSKTGRIQISIIREVGAVWSCYVMGCKAGLASTHLSVHFHRLTVPAGTPSCSAMSLSLEPCRNISKASFRNSSFAPGTESPPYPLSEIKNSPLTPDSSPAKGYHISFCIHYNSFQSVLQVPVCASLCNFVSFQITFEFCWNTNYSYLV